MTLTEAVVGLAILVGLLGIVVPVLPGGILIFGAVLVWAVVTGGATAWVVFAVAAALPGARHGREVRRARQDGSRRPGSPRSTRGPAWPWAWPASS